MICNNPLAANILHQKKKSAKGGCLLKVQSGKHLLKVNKSDSFTSMESAISHSRAHFCDFNSMFSGKRLRNRTCQWPNMENIFMVSLCGLSCTYVVSRAGILSRVKFCEQACSQATKFPLNLLQSYRITSYNLASSPTEGHFTQGNS